MAIIVKGVFPIVYKQTGKVCYTLTDPSIFTLRGEIEDECMGAFRVETDMDGEAREVTGVFSDGTLVTRSLSSDEFWIVPEVGTVQETMFGIYVDESGVLRG